MDDKIKESLDAVFERHEAARREAAKIQRERARAKNEALAKFVEVRDSTIRPAMEQVAAYLKDKGVFPEIAIQDDKVTQTSSGPKMISASITMKIKRTPGANGSGGQEPFLQAILDKNKGEVTFHDNTVSNGRSGGESATVYNTRVDQVTEALVQQKLLQLIEKLFG